MADLNKKIESLTKAKVGGDVEQALRNVRKAVVVDNKAFLASWDKQVSKSPAISCVMKSIFQFVFKRNTLLSLHYVPSKENPADSPSRTLSDLDCSLSRDTWKCVETAFGSHSIDLHGTTRECTTRSFRAVVAVLFPLSMFFRPSGQTFFPSTYKLTKTRTSSHPLCSSAPLSSTYPA